MNRKYIVSKGQQLSFKIKGSMKVMSLSNTVLWGSFKKGVALVTFNSALAGVVTINVFVDELSAG